MKHPRILWLAGLLSVALAGCGVTSTPETVAQPGAGIPATPNLQPAPTVTSASLRITIPVLLSSAGDLTSQYVSAGTRSLTVSIDGSTPKVFNVGAGLGTCSGTGPFTCTLTIGQISPGPHTFSIAAYDAPNAGGHLLGNIGPVDATLSAGIDNALSFTLTGIVNGLKVQPSVSDAQDQPATGYWLLNTGVPRSFMVTQYDAANQVISGPGTPAVYACSSDPRVSVTSDDHAGTFTLSTSAADLTDLPVTLEDAACSTGTARSSFHVANAVTLTLDANTALPTSLTGSVKVKDANNVDLPDLTVRGSRVLAPGSYTLFPQVITDGPTQYTPASSSVSVVLALGMPVTRTVTYAAAIHLTFSVTASTTTPNAGTPVTITAQLTDASNQPFKQAGDTVTWSSTGGGSFSSPTSTTDANGAATITFTPNPASGSTQVVTATTTASGTVVTGSSTSLITQGPPSAIADAPSSTSVPGDLFHLAFNGGAHTSTTAENLLKNDTLGFPTAAITSFGGGSLGGSVADHAAGSSVSFGTGGAVQLNADGSFTFTPAAGFTGNFTFSYHLTSSAGSSDATVTLAVGQRPGAVNDSYTPTVVGNVPINTAKAGGSGFSLLSNDVGSDLQVTGSDTVTTNGGGTVSVNPNGTFSFIPASGFTGNTSFNYTAANGFGSKTATVNLSVAGRVWFVDNTASAGGDGRQSTPFKDLTSFAAVNDAAGLHPADNDAIFVASGSGSYTGGLTLRTGQKLIGQGSSLSIAAAAGLTVPADASLPSTSGTAPTIISSVNGLNLASSNTLRGFNLGNATGTALNGANFGTLTLAEVGITTSGQALNLSNGTLNGSFAALRSTGGTNNVLLSNISTVGTSTLGSSADALSNASGDALKINGGTGSFSYPGSISNTATLAVNIANKTGGTVTLSGAVNPASVGKGVALTSNTGATLNFSGPLKISTNGNGFSATGGGTVTATGTGSTLSSAGGIALNVSDTTIGSGGLNFQSVSANGGTNGIFLNNTGTTAGLTVSGTGTAGSGGTLQNTSGGDGATAGNGVYLNNTRNVTLKWMQLNDHQNNALYGSAVRGLVLDQLNTQGNNGTSNSGTYQESSVHLVDLGGTVSITNSTLNGGAYDSTLIQNTAGTSPTLNLTFSNNIVSQMQGSTADVRNTAFQVIASDGTANVTALSNTFTYWWGNAIQVAIQGNAVGTAALRNNRALQTSGALAGAGGIEVNGGNLTFDISNNTVAFTNGTAISVDKNPGNTSLNGTVSGNQVGYAATSAGPGGAPPLGGAWPSNINSGSAAGTGIFAAHTGVNATTIKVSNNTIRQVNGTQAIWLLTGDDTGGGGSGTMNATVTGNNIAEEGSNTGGRTGIIVQTGRVTADTDLMCADLSGNSITNFSTRIRPNQRFNTKMFLPGYPGTSGDTAAVNSYLIGRNPGTTNLAAASTSGGGGYFNTSGGAACPQPTPLP